MTQKRIDIDDEIDALRAQRNAVILAHYYQEPETQDIADHMGDSLPSSGLHGSRPAEGGLFVGYLFRWTLLGVTRLLDVDCCSAPINKSSVIDGPPPAARRLRRPG
jgi:hypothetical protein